MKKSKHPPKFETKHHLNWARIFGWRSLRSKQDVSEGDGRTLVCFIRSILMDRRMAYQLAPSVESFQTYEVKLFKVFTTFFGRKSAPKNQTCTTNRKHQETSVFLEVMFTTESSCRIKKQNQQTKTPSLAKTLNKIILPTHRHVSGFLLGVSLSGADCICPHGDHGELMSKSRRCI